MSTIDRRSDRLGDQTIHTQTSGQDERSGKAESRRPSRSQRSASPAAPRSRPPRLPGRMLLTVQDYIDHYIEEGDRLMRSGVEPSVEASAYVQAFPRLQGYLRHHGEALGERGVVSAEIDAGQALLDRLAASSAEHEAHQGRTPQPGLIAAAAGKLAQMRDSVRRLTRGHDDEREQLGLAHRVETCSAASVSHGIELFLAGVRAEPERLHRFRLIPRDIEELEEYVRLLRGLLGDRGPGSPAIGPLSEEALAERRDHLAVEAYYASLAAAISMAFAERDPRRIAGLKLIPRHNERRSKSRPQPRLWRAPLPSIDE